MADVSDVETEQEMDMRVEEPMEIPDLKDEAKSDQGLEGQTVNEKKNGETERNGTEDDGSTMDRTNSPERTEKQSTPEHEKPSPEQEETSVNATEPKGEDPSARRQEQSPVKASEDRQSSPKDSKRQKEDSFLKNYLSDSYGEDDFESGDADGEKPDKKAKNTKTNTRAKQGNMKTTKDLRKKGKQTQENNRQINEVKEKKKEEKQKPKRREENQVIERNRRPPRTEPSTKWKNLRLFDNDTGSDEEKMNNKTPTKPKTSRKESRRFTLLPERRSVATRPDTEYSGSSTESEDEDDRVMDGKVKAADLPSEYWQIQRMVKFLKIGNPTATVICLCALRDFNLSQEMCQMAIRDINGLQILINLLKTEDDKCKIGSLQILQPLTTTSKYNRNSIINLGGVQLLINLVTSGSKEVQSLAAATLANITKSSRARNILRRCGGIRKMVKLLNYQDEKLNKRKQIRSYEQQTLDLEVSRCAALALWSCSTSMRNRTSIFKAGSVPLLAKLIKLDREELLIPIVGLVQECAVEARYRHAFKHENMIEAIVRHLQTENEELRIYCANAIFKCAEDEDTRKVVNQFGGLEPLVKLLSQSENKKQLAAITGAIWKCSISVENAKRFLDFKVIETLLKYLQDDKNRQPEQVQVHIVGALSELAKVPRGRKEILACKGCRTFVELSVDPNEELVEQVARAIAACSEDPECRDLMNSLDGLRLLWSLLKSSNPKVVASAAWGLYGLMEDTPEAWENARSFVGGLELIVTLLRSDDTEVLTSACAAISNVANDGENIGVITDYGVVPLLARLTHLPDMLLRRHLAEAIARCSKWGSNARDFSDEGAVEAMVEYLSTDDTILKRSAVRALHQLARNPESCIKMHSNGVVKPLVEMVGSYDEALQEAAAGCLLNIRKLAMANEKARQKEWNQSDRARSSPTPRTDNSAA